MCVCVDGKLVEFSALLARSWWMLRDGWRRDRCSLQKEVLMAAAAHADKLEITIFDASQNTKRVCCFQRNFITRRVSREKCVHAACTHGACRWLHLS